jgi:phage/plasmid-associated DNA primase
MDGDIALIAFLQRFLGYTLTGSTVEQCFVFLYGNGEKREVYVHRDGAKVDG